LSPGRVKNFLHILETDSRATQSPIQWVPGTISQEVKRPGDEADQSFPTSAEVKETCLYIHFPIRLHVVAFN
jgi:hypothetical protein